MAANESASPCEMKYIVVVSDTDVTDNQILGLNNYEHQNIVENCVVYSSHQEIPMLDENNCLPNSDSRVLADDDSYKISTSQDETEKQCVISGLENESSNISILLNNCGKQVPNQSSITESNPCKELKSEVTASNTMDFDLTIKNEIESLQSTSDIDPLESNTFVPSEDKRFENGSSSKACSTVNIKNETGSAELVRVDYGDTYFFYIEEDEDDSEKEDESLKCGLCSRFYAFDRECLKRHMEHVHSHANNCECERCILQPPTKKEHTCSVCDKSFNTVWVLRNHKRVHDATRKKRFHCIECGNSYYSKESLEHHMEKHCPTEQAYKYKCDQCSALFRGKREFKTHAAKEHSVRLVDKKVNSAKFKCDFCGALLSTEWSLRDHIQRIHERKKTFKCDMCEWAFFNSSSLRKHKKRHDKDKLDTKRTYSCQLCNRRYTLITTLVTHMQSHHPDVKY